MVVMRGLLTLTLLFFCSASATAQSGLRFPADPTDRSTLSVTIGGTGAGTVTGPGSSTTPGGSCTSPGCTTATAEYIVNTTVSIFATPASGSTFDGWSGACSGTGTCTVTMGQAQSVTATFTAIVVGAGVLIAT